ncbi:MAG: GNAT family N-acetyltransferase [Micromonosporaceae bacterium]|nr:GNAT family N-acetyltransferase [Micromonosporaceae bacterium]
MTTTYAWRAAFGNGEVNALHAGGFNHPASDDDRWTQVNKHSLGWVCARRAGRLVGFVNVAWDGGIHAFLLDTLVTTELQRQGVGTRLVAVAESRARAGCRWLHVDFTEQLRTFYVDACGFRPTNAGLIAL